VIKSNQLFYETPQFEVLTEEMREAILSAALEILQRTGVNIQHEDALSLLRDAGARIVNDVAYIPERLVREALRSAPSKILIYDRNGTPAMRLEPGYYYFGTGSECPNVLDSRTGEIRHFLQNDIKEAVTIMDSLENIDFVMSLGIIWDRPVHVADIVQFQEMVFNTTKPIVFTSYDQRGNEDIRKMAAIATGDEDQLAARPFIVHYIEPSSPLRASKEAMEKLLYCAENSIPSIYTPCPSGGATSPVTMAGTLAQTLAESLSGIVVSQLKQPGAPVILGGVLTVMDMKTTTYLYGGPEFHVMEAALGEIGKHLGIPVFGTAGCSDAKVVDQQAAIEGTLSIALGMLGGANLIHDVGYLSSGLVGSNDMLVMSNETIGMMKRYMRGIKVDEEHLALDLIDKVGPKGNFLAESHTMRHFKQEQWYPGLLDRRGYAKWEQQGSKTLGHKTTEKTMRILREHKPEPLEESKQREILDLIAHEEKHRQVRY
jgi:trimethylamine---corrinoid protein Co-methyltransferase